jgi:hypothetical protein
MTNILVPLNRLGSAVHLKFCNGPINQLCSDLHLRLGRKYMRSYLAILFKLLLRHSIRQYYKDNGQHNLKLLSSLIDMLLRSPPLSDHHLSHHLGHHLSHLNQDRSYRTQIDFRDMASQFLNRRRDRLNFSVLPQLDRLIVGDLLSKAL